jgi:hypothetical protein
MLEYCVDVLGRTRATLTEPTSSSPWPKGPGNLVKLCRAGDRALQLLLFNEEFLVGASHQLVPTTSLPFERQLKINWFIKPYSPESRLTKFDVLNKSDWLDDLYKGYKEEFLGLKQRVG